MPWLTCSTIGCDSPLQAFSTFSGVAIGYGAFTAVAGVLLTAIGIDALRHDGVSRFAAPATVLALLAFGTVSAFFISTYLFADYSLSIEWPPRYGAILTAAGALIAFAASFRVRRSTPAGPGRAPPT